MYTHAIHLQETNYVGPTVIAVTSYSLSSPLLTFKKLRCPFKKLFSRIHHHLHQFSLNSSHHGDGLEINLQIIRGVILCLQSVISIHKMAKSYIRSFLTLFLVFEILISSSLAATDRLDVEALNDLYENFSRPSQLIGWKSDGGDPCEDSWKGVSCNGTSVIYIELTGLGLSGQLGESFYLQNLKQLDLSSNYIQGEIPRHLPLNLTYLELRGRVNPESKESAAF